jgi:uracil phosphoribosyltransferase
MIYNFSETNSLFNNFLKEIRDEEIQRDMLRFRRNLERISEIMAYELSKQFKYSAKKVTTTLGEATMNVFDEELVLATILRAGLPMHYGLMNYFDRAESAFVSAYRKHTTEEDYDVQVEYCAAPNIDDKILIISDPMIATGSSMTLVYKALTKYGTPKQIHIVSAIATQEALDYVKDKLPPKT